MNRRPCGVQPYHNVSLRVAVKGEALNEYIASQELEESQPAPVVQPIPQRPQTGTATPSPVQPDTDEPSSCPKGASTATNPIETEGVEAQQQTAVAGPEAEVGQPAAAGPRAPQGKRSVQQGRRV